MELYRRKRTTRICMQVNNKRVTRSHFTTFTADVVNSISLLRNLAKLKGSNMFPLLKTTNAQTAIDKKIMQKMLSRIRNRII